jgi:hypothetical protein
VPPQTARSGRLLHSCKAVFPNATRSRTQDKCLPVQKCSRFVAAHSGFLLTVRELTARHISNRQVRKGEAVTALGCLLHGHLPWYVDAALPTLHTGTMVSVCASTGWSAVTSATANATLAGVLAGFMLNGIVLLLSRRSDRTQGAGYAQGAALLFTAFIALGLDSYLFGLVTGDRAARACRRAWTEAMFAAGLLGLGAVAVVAGIIFLLGVLLAVSQKVGAAAGRGNVAGDDYSITESRDLLADLCNVLRPGVAAVVMFLLWVTTRSYLYAIFGSHVPLWADTLVRIEVGADYIILILYLVVHRWWQRKILPWLDNRIEGPDKIRLRKELYRGAKNIMNLMWELVQPDSGGGIKTPRMLKTAVMSSLFYSIGSVIIGGGIVLIPVTFWSSGHLLVYLIIGGTITWVLLVTLLPLGALLAPGYGPQYPAPNICVLCRKRLGRATHVMPPWARWGDFDIQGPVTVNAYEEPRADAGKNEMQLSITVRNAICRSCNTHWLRRLERNVKPILAPMASGNWEPLDQVGEELIATWAVKTIKLFELANHQKYPASRLSDGSPTSGKELATLRTEKKPPSHLQVWLGHWDSQKATPEIRKLSDTPLPTSDGGSVEWHLTTLTLGRVAFQVFTDDHAAEQHETSPRNVKLPMPLERALICIWPPPRARLASWPPPALTDKDWERLVTWEDGL